MNLRIFLLFLACVAVGQARAASEQDKELVVGLMSWRGHLSGLFVGQEPEPDMPPVDAPEFALGAEVTVRRTGASVPIIREQTVDGELRRVTLAVASIPLTIERAIILLAPAPAGAAFPFQARVLDDSPNAHPGESIRLLNYSSRSLALRVGPETFMGEPGGERIFSYAGGAAPRVFFQLAAQTEEGWQMIARRFQSAPKGRRFLCIVRDGRTPDGVTLDSGAKVAPVDAMFILR